jgi:spermidine/putrescine transport system substrate-binding protein
MSSLNRRDFLVRSALLGLGGPAFFAACSKKDEGSSGGSDAGADGSSATESAAAAGGDKPSKVRIASWPLYIENDGDPQKAATIVNFAKATGIKVDYQTAVDSNDSFTTKYEGDLKAGKGIGFDVVILTSWMCSRWIANGWAEKVPDALVPNKANLQDRLKNPSWDPNRQYTLPYAIGQVGIAYYPDKVGREVTSIADLLSPDLKGKVTILSEMRDTVSMFLLLDGVKPEEATVAQALAAIEKIKKAREAGQFREVVGNSYTEDLALGDIACAIAWSGDVASIQADNPDLKWVLPKEGGGSFVDTMLVPKGANIEAAAAWMNYVYDPAVSGALFEKISYTSPVVGAGAAMSPEAQKNPVINPPADADIHDFRDLTEAESFELEKAFVAATQQ